MRRWKWLAVLAVVGVLAAIPGVTSAFAHGPTDPQDPPSYGGWWQEMSQHCPGAGGMMAGWGMRVGEMGLGHPVTLGRVADTLRLTYEELTARLAQGETIAQVAMAQRVAVESVATTILAPQSEVLQIRVHYGYLSETQAQAILEQARLWIEQAITVSLYGSVGPSDGATSGYGPGYGSGAWVGPNTGYSPDHAPGYSRGSWGGPGGMMGGGMERGMMGGGMMGW